MLGRLLKLLQRGTTVRKSITSTHHYKLYGNPGWMTQDLRQEEKADEDTGPILTPKEEGRSDHGRCLPKR